MNIKSLRTSAKFALVALVTVGGLVGAPTAANAEPVPAGQELYVTSATASQNPNNNTVFAFGVLPTPATGGYAADGTKLKLDVYSCGNFLQSVSTTVSSANGKGAMVYFNDSAVRRVGTSLQYNLTVTQAGYDSYVRSGSYDGYNVRRPSCAAINGAVQSPATCTVSRAAARVGVARVGRTVKVSRPVVSSACGSVSYVWKANGRKVQTGATLRVSKGLKGKALTSQVVLSKGPDSNLKFGRVRG